MSAKAAILFMESGNLIAGEHFRKVRKKMETKLYIGNLAFSTTEDELKGLFAEAGTITSCEVIKDRFTGSSKGFAFIEMSNQAEAEKAINLFNGYSLGERAIKVSPAKPREESGSGGFGGPRRDGGNRGGQGGPGGGRNRTGSGGGQRRY